MESVLRSLDLLISTCFLQASLLQWTFAANLFIFLGYSFTSKSPPHHPFRPDFPLARLHSSHWDFDFYLFFSHSWRSINQRVRTIAFLHRGPGVGLTLINRLVQFRHRFSLKTCSPRLPVPFLFRFGFFWGWIWMCVGLLSGWSFLVAFRVCL